MNYRKINNLTGWITGAIAFIVYLMTMEATASFWDCGEFLSCAYKLEVGHSPGAPFFMMLQRIFGLFASGNTTTGGPSPNAAIFINALSALMSGLTILFLFWSITHFAKKLIVKGDAIPDNSQILLIMGAGLVGGLAYTISDTFWFSAVEAEVYATSSFFTAITFWAVLKWEAVADNKYADRWLVLIAYLIGISVCVHLLNLLTIPAVAMVYYYRRFKSSTLGAILAFVVGCVVLAFVQFGVIQYIPKLAANFDILFTNSFNAPFDTGAVFFLVLMSAVLIGLLLLAKSKKIYALHTSVLCVIFIIIGYSSYFAAIVRSRADVPIDMTNPDNPITFLDYVDREQFGQQPIFFGPYFSSIYSSIDTDKKVYSQLKNNGKDIYAVVGKKTEPVYEGDQLHFFPRIYEGNEPNHVNFYKSFCGIKDKEEPTGADNMHYFFGYQMDWMYWRFFMWNFAGRQNDIEGQGDPQNGNWITGIPFLDQMRGLGDTDKMGDGYSTNGAHNKLYCLPLILGILGLIYQFKRNSKDGYIVLTLFFFTGAAIGIYLNMPPVQPRERDYAFAGCTYTFAIWIGLGVIMVADLIRKFVNQKSIAEAISIVVCLVAVPMLMANVEWNDHDRSKKTLARAVAFNTLSCCAPNAVLFTFGDNQTYPLWYIQEVEGFRKDVRIINTSLLGIDWYIDQLNYKVNDADAVPMMWKKESYLGTRNNYIRYFDRKQIQQDKYYNLSEICDFMNSNDMNNMVQLQSGEYVNFMPAKHFFVPPVSKDYLVKNNLAKAEDTSNIVTDFKINYPKEVAYKSDLAILNIIAAVAKDGWKRPLYFDAGLRQGEYGGTGDYMHREGVVYRLMPYKFNDSIAKLNPQDMGTINTEKSYDLFMHTFVWGGAERNDVYFDEPNRHEFVTYRMDAALIANALTTEGKKDKAVQVLDKTMAGITEHSYTYDMTAYYIAAAYYIAGAQQKAAALTNKIVRNSVDNINWVSTLRHDGKIALADDIRRQFQIIQSLGMTAAREGDSAMAKQLIPKMDIFVNYAFNECNWIGSLQSDEHRAYASYAMQQFQLMQYAGSYAQMVGDIASAKGIEQKLQIVYPKIKDLLDQMRGGRENIPIKEEQQ